ncbi:hypothetical protein SRABI106_03182 [Rahnella aquatilis]|nr:hypothetical protein SRABI106_03182 [Rahnella aquatilis]
MIVVGRARQDLSWIAEESDGWIWHLSDFSTLPELLEFWRGGYDDNRFRPYGYATFFDLDANPDAPLRRLMNGITVGRNALIKLWKEQERQGVNHVALNLKPLTRPAAEVMAEMAEFVLPEFPSE